MLHENNVVGLGWDELHFARKIWLEIEFKIEKVGTTVNNNGREN